MIGSIFTHFICTMLGGTVGVLAMAFLIAGKDVVKTTDGNVTYKCDGCPYVNDYDCPASYTYCWKDMNGGKSE